MSFKKPKSPRRSPESVRSNSSEKKSHDDQGSQFLFDDYEGSEFEFGLDNNEKKLEERKQKIPENKNTSSSYESGRAQTSGSALPPKSSFVEAQSKEEGRVRAMHFASMNAYSKHIKLVNDYLMYYSGGKTLKEVFQRDTSKDKTDLDVIREEMKFVWDDDEPVDTWEKRLAKRYYDKLFKEYCICDLTYYKVNKIAMRWRIDKEVLAGKGQFICGEKKCNSREGLKTWEVNFGYVEHGVKKNALVKLRLCGDCSLKLNFHTKKKEYIKPSKPKKTSDKSSKTKSNSSDESESGENKTNTSTNKNKRTTNSENEDDEEEKAQKRLKKDAEDATEMSGNSIILKGDDSMWKSNEKTATSSLAASNKDTVRDNEFEDYLEDLFM